ncbi:MAG: hypothetical protein V2A34_09465 [Lentisphaerota bacterium]
MIYTTISCDRCKAVFQPGLFNTASFIACPNCLAASHIQVFPAFYRSMEGVAPATRLIDNEASCFYHADKQAVIPCDVCGRFLCALCDMEFSGRHLCPACLQQQKAAGSEKKLEARFIHYDQLALSMAALPMLVFPLWFFTMFTAPATLYVIIRYWKAPLSILPRSKARMVVAGLLATGQLIGWLAVLYLLAEKAL